MSNDETQSAPSAVSNERPNSNGQAQFALPRGWMWEFGHSKCFQYHGPIQFAVIECWSYQNGTTSASPPTVVRRYDEYRQDQIFRRLQEPIPLCDGNKPSLGFQMVVVSLNTRHLPQLGDPALEALNEALGLPHSHHHYSSWSFGAVGMFQLPDGSWCTSFPVPLDICVNCNSVRSSANRGSHLDYHHASL